jgi:hypothetical protein
VRATGQREDDGLGADAALRVVAVALGLVRMVDGDQMYAFVAPCRDGVLAAVAGVGHALAYDAPHHIEFIGSQVAVGIGAGDQPACGIEAPGGLAAVGADGGQGLAEVVPDVTGGGAVWRDHRGGAAVDVQLEAGLGVVLRRGVGRFHHRRDVARGVVAKARNAAQRVGELVGQAPLVPADAPRAAAGVGHR